MKKIYIDSEFMCHMESVPGSFDIDTTLFDGCSDQDIEAMRYIPYGHVWTDPDTGLTYHGDHMINTTLIRATEAALYARIEVLEQEITELKSHINSIGKTELTGEGTQENPFIWHSGIEAIPNAYYSYNGNLYVYMGATPTISTEEPIDNGLTLWALW